MVCCLHFSNYCIPTSTIKRRPAAYTHIAERAIIVSLRETRIFLFIFEYFTYAHAVGQHANQKRYTLSRTIHCPPSFYHSILASKTQALTLQYANETIANQPTNIIFIYLFIDFIERNKSFSHPELPRCPYFANTHIFLSRTTICVTCDKSHGALRDSTTITRYSHHRLPFESFQ